MAEIYYKSNLSYEDETSLALAVDEIFKCCSASSELSEKSRVLLKPNLLAKHGPEKAVTTHPAIVVAVAKALHSRGVKDITLADSSGGIYTEGTMKSIYKAAGLAKVCDEYGIKVWDKTSYAAKAVDGVICKEFNLITPVLESDFIINLPKIKTHVMTGMTCAVKNLFGCVPGLQKAEFHMRFPAKENFGQMLCDLCKLVSPQMTIADGILALEGDGPAGGEPREVGVLIGGENPYFVDIAAAKLIGIKAEIVPYLNVAIAAGLCPAELPADAFFEGSDELVPEENYKLPHSYESLTFDEHVPMGLRWATPLVTKLAAPRPVIKKLKCIGCGKCAEICPGKTIDIKSGKAYINKENCILCFCCHEMCPVKAIDVKRMSLFNM